MSRLIGRLNTKWLQGERNQRVQLRTMVKNLEYIARSAMFYLKKSSDQDYAHFLQYAKHWYTEVVPHYGLRRLGVYYAKLDKLSRLGLPPDFAMYTNIGVLSGNKVYPLTPTISFQRAAAL